MALYAIGDLHLSLGTNKPMDVFGSKWANYVERIQENFSKLNDDDVIVLAGDISWGMSLEQSLPDFQFIDALPGKKLLLKGNHDYWWSSLTQLRSNLPENMHAVQNDAFDAGDVVFCGTRGWTLPQTGGAAADGPAGSQDEKIFRRELGRLEASLKAAGGREKLCFLHYPPKYRGYECPEILQLLHEYGVKRCYYGHLHADSIRLAIQGESDGIDFRLVSADYVNFKPQKVLD